MPEVSTEQIQKAVGALMAFTAGEVKSAKQKDSDKKELFESEEEYSVIINLRKVPDQDKQKPIPISIPHTLYGRDGVSICLFTKDPQSAFDEYLENNPVKNVKKVVSLKTLRTDYKSFQHRRELLNQFDFFFADDRITPLLPALLGAKFYDSKRQPPAVQIDKGFKKNLTKARDSTYLHISKGPLVNVKVGHSDFTKAQLVENIVAAISNIVDRIPRKWKNVQSIFIKTTNSASLPVYTALPVATDFVKDVEEKKAEEEENQFRERKALIKKAATYNMTVGEYESALKAADKLSMPLGKYIKAKKMRALQLIVERKGGKVSADATEEPTVDAEEEIAKLTKPASIVAKEAAAAAAATEVEEVKEKSTKRVKKTADKADGEKIVSLTKGKKVTAKGNKK